jgi:hypothetical protein
MIEYGFFNSLKTADGTTYDRLYNSSNFNDYFKGVISQNGVFSNVGGKCKLKLGSGMNVIVSPGKALINGHWMTIDSDHVVDLSKMWKSTSSGIEQVNSWDLIYDKYCTIVLRCDEGKRTCSVVARFGAASATPYAPNPQGWSMDSNGNYKFAPTSSGITELGLGYVKIRHSGATAPGLVKSDLMQDWVGTSRCPYISHLVIGPSQKDLDEWLAKASTSFVEWYSKVQKECQIDTSIGMYKRTVVGANKKPKDLLPGEVQAGTSKLQISSATIPGYTYEDSDIIFVYYNGLFLCEDDEWTREPGNVVLKNVVNEDNVINIIILKSKMGPGGSSLPDGNNIYY